MRAIIFGQHICSSFIIIWCQKKNNLIFFFCVCKRFFLITFKFKLGMLSIVDKVICNLLNVFLVGKERKSQMLKDLCTDDDKKRLVSDVAGCWKLKNNSRLRDTAECMFEFDSVDLAVLFIYPFLALSLPAAHEIAKYWNWMSSCIQGFKFLVALKLTKQYIYNCCYVFMAFQVIKYIENSFKKQKNGNCLFVNCIHSITQQ